MKRLFKRVLPLVLSAAMLPLNGVGISASAANDTDGVFVNVPFNNMATSETTIDGLTISGGSARVEKLTSKNKALHMCEADSDTKIVAAFEPSGDDFVTYSIDLIPGKTDVNVKIGLASDATGDNCVDFLIISDNAIKTAKNKYIGSISGTTNVAITVCDDYLYSVYVNGKCVLSGWKAASQFTAKSLVVRQLPGYDSYIDNIRIYKSEEKKPLRKFAETAMNPDVKDALGMGIGYNDDAGDKTFFDNRYCITSGGDGKYFDTNLTPKTNKITASRLTNLKDPHRTDEIHIEKIDPSNDCFIDVFTTRYNRVYKYYKFEGDFKIDKLGARIQLPMIREIAADGSYKGNDAPFEISGDGSITFAGGSVAKAITEGEWFNFKAYFDVATGKADAWLNGKQIAKDVSISKAVECISMIRIYLVSGEGDLWLDNCNFTGLSKPFTEDGKEVKSYILPSEEPIEEYLSDKVAYGAFGNLLVVDGEKIELEKRGEYDPENIKFYVPADTIARAFKLELTSGNSKISGDITVTADGNVTLKDGTKFKLTDKVIDKDGELLVPFEELGEKISGLKAWTLKSGIIVFADHEIKFDGAEDYQYPIYMTDTKTMSDLEFLSSYLNYVHPDAERMKTDYEAKFGSVTSTQHPRVILDADDFAEHKKHYEARDDEYYSKIADRMINIADGYIEKNSYATYIYADDVRGNFYGFQERFIAWGYAWQMTGDQKYIDAAVKQFEIICNDMPDFNEAHILDAGQSLRGLAIGFDWFYNGFTDEQREKYAQMIMNKGINRVGNGLYGRLTEGALGTDNSKVLRQKFNINALVVAGIENACIALMEYDPENYMQMLADSLRSMEIPLSLLAPAGGWIESVGYWDYMMRSLVWGTASIESAFGTDYGLMDGQGANRTIESIISCFGNSIGNNYGDGEVKDEHSYPPFAYFAKRNGDRAAFYARKLDIMSKGDSKIDFNDFIFYDFSNNDATAMDLEKYGNMIRTDGVELLTIRDTFNPDKSKMFFSTHFGTTSGYHQHDDCGSFVLEMMGEAWVEDLGRESYTLQNFGGVSGKPIYRNNAEGHSMMLINPKAHTGEHHTVNGQIAPIIAADANEHGGYVYADMDDVYEDATKMTLGYYVDDDMNSVTMRNEYTLKSDNDVYWVFQTPADACVVGNTVYLTKNGKTLKVEFMSTTGDGKWTVTDAEPFDFTPEVQGQTVNEGYKRVALKLSGKQGDNTLVVKMSNASIKTKPMQNKTFSQWTLPETGAPATVEFDTSFVAKVEGVEIGDFIPVLDGKMPKVTVVPNNPSAVVEIAEAATPDEQTIIVVSSPDKSICSVISFDYKGMKSGMVSVEGFYDVPIYGTKVSSTPEPANNKANITDYDFTTRWTCMKKGEYAIFDLGSVKTIEGVAAAFWKGNVRKYYYDIYVSNDGTNWTEMKTNLSSDGQSEELNTTLFSSPIQTRYIKLVGQGNSETGASNVNTNVLEFRALSRTK